MKRLAIAIGLALTACGGGDDQGSTPGARIEAAAVASGVIADPAKADPNGTFGRDSDRVCILGEGRQRRIGIYSYYGDDLTCTARGHAEVDGETLDIRLGESDRCRIKARFDGNAIAFPGSTAEECASFCDAPASLAGLSVERFSDSPAEAQSLRGGDGTALCPSS